MANNESNPRKDLDESCVFCLIAHNRDEVTTVIKQDEELVCFSDIYPAAPHHYLVVPREHILSCRSLNRRNIDLVERMAKFGKEVLFEQGITDLKDVRLRGGAVCSTVALQQEGPGFNSFCMEFACSPCAGSHRVLWLPHTLQKYVCWLIGLSKLPLGVHECVHGCLCVALQWTAGDRHQLPCDPLWKKR
ncbi:hypothetical protein CHARACLAT_004467 [Characodon lateralis]|uniref:HIT domain-containing protein n=1 Tax=Characodon lateralis TaxID=208331 RepID=A0ABU7DHE1_9TELE|nr:hypothetical protein [Characodon lateralis]